MVRTKQLWLANYTRVLVRLADMYGRRRIGVLRQVLRPKPVAPTTWICRMGSCTTTVGTTSTTALFVGNRPHRVPPHKNKALTYPASPANIAT